MSIFNNFIANETEFNRKLTNDEFLPFSAFPNAKQRNVGFLGKGSIRPTEENCKKYHCMFTGKVVLYNTTDNEFVEIINPPFYSIESLQKKLGINVTPVNISAK